VTGAPCEDRWMSASEAGSAARQAGVPDERLLAFATQDDAVRAVHRGEIDAAASTAIGNLPPERNAVGRPPPGSP
jgi:hypothetical protein